MPPTYGSSIQCHAILARNECNVKFLVYSRFQVQAPPDKHVFISIQTPGDAHEVSLPITANTVDVLRMQFHDADLSHAIPVIGEGEIKPVLFNLEMGEQIVDFWLKNKDLVSTFVVHCDAGHCRSPAVAAALTKIDGGDDTMFFKRYMPNRRVYTGVLSAATHSGLI